MTDEHEYVAPDEQTTDEPLAPRWPLRLAAVIAAVALLIGAGSMWMRLWSAERTRPAAIPVDVLPAMREPRTLYLTGGSPPSHLDPVRTFTVWEFELLYNTLEGLVRVNADGGIEPALAERWDCQPGASVCRFHLREGARWSDGVEVIADDFVYGWLRMLEPAHASENAGRLYLIEGAQAFNTLNPDASAAAYEAARAAVGVSAPDRYTLEVRLEAVPAYFLSFLADATYMPQRQDIVEQHGAAYATSPDTMVFNGPFVIGNWDQHGDVIMRANPLYWDAESVQLDQVVWMPLDWGTAAAMFDAGELDELRMDADARAYYRNHPGLLELPDASTLFLIANMDSPAMARPEVRQALHLALDRTVIAEAIYDGSVVPAPGFVPPALPGLPGKSFRDAAGPLVPGNADASRARELWQQALAADGLTTRELTLLHFDGGGSRAEAALFASLLEHTLPGLTVQLSASDFEQLAERRRQQDFDLMTIGWVADYDDAASFLHMFRSDEPTNFAGYRNASYDSLLEQADRTADVVARVTLMAEAEAMLLTDLPVLPIYHGRTFAVRQPHVSGIVDVPAVGIVFLKNAQVAE